jgi:NADPH:quinone reductase-like Zn-dependent oxidoreductase
MKSIQLDKFGIENLKITNTQKPVPGPNEVLVKIEAASLNYLDLMVINGQYNPELPLPHVPCSDGSGWVESTGSDVTLWKKGDRVTTHFIQHWISGSKTQQAFLSRTGLEKPGVLSEYILIHETALVRTPGILSAEEASTLPIAALTAWAGLFEYARIKPGQTVLTQGSGGVSIFALQLAKAAGARVIAISGSPAKLEKLRALGADEVIDYRKTPDWHVEARRLTDSHGVDAILDVVGTDTLTKSIYALKADGFIGLTGNLSGAVVPFNIYDTVPSNATLRGISVGSIENFQALLKAINTVKLKPVIDTVFPIDKIHEAYRYMQQGTLFGKIVIRIE